MTAPRQRPAAFSDERLAAARARAEAERRWLLVDVTDASKPVAWAALYTTWRDPDVVAWLEANAVAVQVDARLDPDDARALGVEPAAAPVVILLRDGKERLRVQGHVTAAELVKKLEHAEAAEENLRLARLMMKDPEREPMDREGLADALLRAGLLEEALAHFDWLWCHAVEVDPEFAGVRVSFMAGRIAELCAALPAARARFAELRDAAAARASTDDRDGRQACIDFVVLNNAIHDEERTLAWLDGLDADRRRALPDGLVRFELLPLLYERERWLDAGGLIRDPMGDLESVLDRAKSLGSVRRRDVRAYERNLIIDGRPAEARSLRRLGRGLHGDVAALHRSLVAAGRAEEAAAVKEAALRFDGSAAMRAALR
jgi:hypothetical protein